MRDSVIILIESEEETPSFSFFSILFFRGEGY